MATQPWLLLYWPHQYHGIINMMPSTEYILHLDMFTLGFVISMRPHIV